MSFFVIYVINCRAFPVLKYAEAEYDCVFSVDGAHSNLHRYVKVFLRIVNLIVARVLLDME